MGNNSEADNKVVESGTAITVSGYTDVYIYMPTSEGEAFGVKVSVEVCCEGSLEDKRCDLTTDLKEAIHQTMVGRYKLAEKASFHEYQGPVIALRGEVVEQS